MAECILMHLARQRSLTDTFHVGQVDSCGTGNFHIGKPPDPRALRVLTQHGIPTAGYSHRARQLQSNDLIKFDFILCMDQLILAQVKQLASYITTTATNTPTTTTTTNTSTTSTATTGTTPSGLSASAAIADTKIPHGSSSNSVSGTTSLDSASGTRMLWDSTGGERQGQPANSVVVRCAIHLLGDFSHQNRLALNQKVDSKDFLVPDPFYNASEEPFEVVYVKCAEYVEAFLDALNEKHTTLGV